MKLSVSAYRAHSSAHKKILSNSYQSQLNYGSTAASTNKKKLFSMDTAEFTSIMDPICPDVAQNREYVAGSTVMTKDSEVAQNINGKWSNSTSRELPAQRKRRGSADDRKHAELEIADWTKSNQRWMKLRTTVQISSAIQKKTPLKREDSFLKRFSTRQIPEAQETVEDSGSESTSGDRNKDAKRRRRYLQKHRYVVNPDENFYFYWLMALTLCILYNFWTLIVRQSFPELQEIASRLWLICDSFTDIVFVLDIVVQLRTGYLEQGLMVYDDKKLASHYIQSKAFLLDIASLLPLDILQLSLGQHPLLRFPRFLKVYRSIKFYYIVESRTVWPNLWRVVNLIHILLILAHWFGCFYFLLSEAEGFQGDWVYPHRPGDYATLSRKYLGSLYWSTLTLTTIGDLPTPETNTEHSDSADGPRSLPRRGLNSRLLRYKSNYGYIFTIVSYLIGVFIFATIVGQVGNVITNRNANRLEYERLLDGAKTYMRHHKVPGGMKRRVLRWYDYSWSRGRIQGGGDINTALGLLPDKLKTELALHVNLSVLKKVTIFQECQPEFLHDLVLKMKAYIFTPGDSICRKGEVAREMFIIADGILEVLSETGKILTTMKAGDFFGEIGILNLDGLNKRTADVRSVGYSELFSLSREDVLTAMKDYPEAQDILQTLGRKRLMEVRSVNKKLANSTKEKNSFINQSGQNHNSEKSAKRIVEKLKFDVKGIKTALRKTRTCRRSDESLETQPLQRSVSTATKAVLTRMPHVESGELFVYDEDRNRTIETPSSPLGAGLPLLHRLRLLKQKQDCEEQATQPLKSSPQAQLISSLSLQQLIQEEPDRLIIGSGLPLLDRLKLLKAKEERIATESYINEIVTKNSSIKSDPPLALSIPSTIPEQNSKVSFKDRFKNTIQQPRIKEATMNDNGKDLWTTGNSLRKNSKTADSEIKDKFKNCQLSENEQSIKPWSKLKSATVLSSSSYVSLSNISNNKEEQESTTEFTTINKLKAQRNLNLDCSKRRLGLSPETFYRKSKHYKTIDDLSPEYRNLTFVQKLRILNERQKLAEQDTTTRPRSCSLDYPDKSNAIKISELLFLNQNDVSKSPSRISKKLSITPVPITPQNYRSPESNETIERRELKSILKQMHKDKSTAMVSKNFSQELKGLMTAPTIDGYVARHSKLLKSVTFNSICSSPPNGHSAEKNDNFHKFSCIPASPIGKNSSGSNQSIRNNIYSSHESVEMQSYNNKSIVLDAKEFQEPDVPDYFNNVVIDIKNIMRSHMLDIHNQSQQRFAQLKYEVQKRDDIIKQLQTTIEELKANELSLFHKSDSICTVSSDENFMKEESGDSMLSVLPTTIFNRGDKEYISHKLYRCSDQFELRNSDQNSIVNSHTYRDFVISNLTRNVTDMSNIRLEMSNSSLQKCTDNKNEEGDKLYCDDWEVRMLAAELDKRDSITGTYSKYEKNVTKLHTPMKHNTSKLKCRGHNVSFRPRSVSLDQCILNDDIAVFPSISFKRDKERL